LIRNICLQIIRVIDNFKRDLSSYPDGYDFTMKRQKKRISEIKSLFPVLDCIKKAFHGLECYFINGAINS